jgi:hypothetical protein
VHLFPFKRRRLSTGEAKMSDLNLLFVPPLNSNEKESASKMEYLLVINLTYQVATQTHTWKLIQSNGAGLLFGSVLPGEVFVIPTGMIHNGFKLPKIFLMPKRILKIRPRKLTIIVTVTRNLCIKSTPFSFRYECVYMYIWNTFLSSIWSQWVQT